MTGVPHNLMRARCKFCGRALRYANLPNRGPVMVHAAGEGAICRQMIDQGRDLISRVQKDKEMRAEIDRRRAELKARVEGK